MINHQFVKMKKEYKEYKNSNKRKLLELLEAISMYKDMANYMEETGLDPFFKKL